MTKQDIYDIIQVLDKHYTDHNMEVRDNILFRFENEDSDWFNYDDKNLWWTHGYSGEDIYEDVVNDNLELQINFDIINDDTLSERLEKKVVTSSFFLKCIKLLEQEFKIDERNFSDDGFNLEISIINQESNENNEKVNLKKFNQFK